MWLRLVSCRMHAPGAACQWSRLWSHMVELVKKLLAKWRREGQEAISSKFSQLQSTAYHIGGPDGEQQAQQPIAAQAVSL